MNTVSDCVTVKSIDQQMNSGPMAICMSVLVTRHESLERQQLDDQ